LTSAATFESRLYQFEIVRRLDRWLYAMPHPPMVVEMAPQYVAAAREGSIRGRLDGVAVEPLPAGSVMPSPVETNVTQPDAVRSALRKVFNHLPARGATVALVVPDPVVRLFILPFDNLPRRNSEALPLLKWRLKKSVPFDMDETVLSWMRQGGREGNLEIVAAVARQRIIREYEQILESLEARAGVVLSSTLAALPLLEERGAAMVARLTGKTLTTVIVHDSSLCVYRSTDMPAEAHLLDPQSMLDEVFPAVAYYQDTWGTPIDRAWLSGFGEREQEFCNALAGELKVSVGSMTDAQGGRDLDPGARDLLRHGLDAVAGWMMTRTS
jgi:type IV pilus assembly protein PilM